MPSTQNSARNPHAGISRVAGGYTSSTTSLRLFFPRPAQSVELVLPDNVSRETVGVDPRGVLRVGEQVHLPVCLLERLADLQLCQPVPPPQHLRGRLVYGMPQLHAGRVVDPVQGVPVAPHDPSIVEDARRCPIAAAEPPDKAPRQRAEERMVQVALAPDGKRPALLLQVEALDPVAL